LTKIDRHVLRVYVVRQKLSFPGGRFRYLCQLHSLASPAERTILESIIFSKVVDYRRDVKRGKISPENKAITDSLLAQYKPTTERQARKRKKS
jgi:hypothetical protein